MRRARRSIVPYSLTALSAPVSPQPATYGTDSAAFPQGAKVWRRLSWPFAQVANAMLLEIQPDGPTWPAEVVDQVVRIGYIACCIDEWFDLRPAYREP